MRLASYIWWRWRWRWRRRQRRRRRRWGQRQRRGGKRDAKERRGELYNSSTLEWGSLVWDDTARILKSGLLVGWLLRVFQAHSVSASTRWNFQGLYFRPGRLRALSRRREPFARANEETLRCFCFSQLFVRLRLVAPKNVDRHRAKRSSMRIILNRHFITLFSRRVQARLHFHAAISKRMQLIWDYLFNEKELI